MTRHRRQDLTGSHIPDFGCAVGAACNDTIAICRKGRAIDFQCVALQRLQQRQRPRIKYPRLPIRAAGDQLVTVGRVRHRVDRAIVRQNPRYDHLSRCLKQILDRRSRRCLARSLSPTHVHDGRLQKRLTVADVAHKQVVLRL